MPPRVGSVHGDGELHGSWYLRRAGTRLLAFGLENHSQLELTGEMASLTRLRQLSSVEGELGSLARSLGQSSAVATLGDVLAPRGWGLLFLELTGRCNERCVHCYASASPDVEEALDWPTIERTLTEAHELGFRLVQLTGGDPLLSPHLLPAAKLASELGLGVEVYTNGLAFREEVSRALAALSARLAFSFYSHDPLVHDAITQTPGSQERTLRAILLGIQMGMRVRVSVIATQDNGSDLDQTRAFLIGHGVPPEALGASREVSVGRGSFRPTQPKFDWERTHGATDTTRGKLAVTYGGRVVPCIFDRDTILGEVRQDGLMRVVSRSANDLGLPRRLTTVSEELSCGDCRFRRSLLGV
jgi:MoaA/NifB/PqqE/SkfB family radical SAM enzyme